ncbi:vacuolar segregation protein 7-like [Bombus vosnesenskii]|uniref:Vacuolar segregation protein 7-like n=1 Tax=Bombus vosnesenskii TaxID=207650 RepID=A0A6J3K883_9HYME|nr:vacuolar segregation protein 7-like [Bombus vosnesenskii]
MVPKVLYLLLIACIFGTVVQMSFAGPSNSSETAVSSNSSETAVSSNSSNSSEASASSKSSASSKQSETSASSKSSGSSESSDSSDSSSDSSASSESEEKPVVKPVDNPKKPGGKPEDKDKRKPQKPPTKQEEAENKTVTKKLEIVLPTIPTFSPIPGLKSNVDKAKDLVARRLNNGGNFVNAVANSIRQAVHAAKPILALGDLISKIIRAFAEIASLNPVRLGALVLQEGVKIATSILTASSPILITGTVMVGR